MFTVSKYSKDKEKISTQEEDIANKHLSEVKTFLYVQKFVNFFNKNI